MNEAYSYKIADLRREIDTEGARPLVIDAAISELWSEGCEDLSSDLLSLLSDGAEHDEGMFSLIHAAESFDDATYVHSFLSVFPGLVLSSPRWASIVLMRILNSEDTRMELIRQLRDSSVETKNAIRDMCERINNVSPQFLSKTVPVTLAAS